MIPDGLTPLQTFAFPSAAVWADEDMYFRYSSSKTSFARLTDRRLIVPQYAIVETDTFYNGMSVGVWKKFCIFDSLVFWLQGEGRFLLRFGLHREHTAHRWLYEAELSVSSDRGAEVHLPFWGGLEDGMLYCQIRSLVDGVITGAGYGTYDPPLQSVKLGITITHFNRQTYVVPAIERTRSELLEDPAYRGRVTLTVVDNSQNIGIHESDGLSVIPNKNLGGSGGFTRGLLALENDATYTHCLFMDDDASCEVESIRRAYAILSYGRVPRLAVAGSLLRELEPFRLVEKGAEFDGLCRPLHSGLDMRNVHDLLTAETQQSLAHYGAWWFFAFPIKDVKSYPFPFFVRGDDILFGVKNNFPLCTMNGIACFGDDFALKSSPLTTYLDLRSILTHSIVHDGGAFSIARTVARFFLSSALSYHYETAQAVLLAIDHISDGGRVFEHDADLSATRKAIANYVSLEKMAPLSMPAEVGGRYEVIGAESRWRTCLRWLTFNGFLVPFAVRKGLVYQPKAFRGKLREIFRYRRVMYRYDPSGMGYVLEYNFFRFWRLFFVFGIKLIRFLVGLPRVRKALSERVDRLSSRRNWDAVYR